MGTIESLAYNPNQEAKLSLRVPIPEGWGANEMSAEIVTCQETVRQMYGAAVNRQTQRTTTLDSAGVHTVSVSKGGVMIGTEVENEPESSPVSTSGSPQNASDNPVTSGLEESGMPTGMEDKVVETIEQSFNQLKNLLKDLDFKVTVQRKEDGAEFHIFNSGGETGVATSSEEKEIPFELLPQAKVEFKGPDMQYADHNTLRLFKETGGAPMTVAAIGSTGKPTVDESGIATVNTQSKTELEQIGLINSFFGFQLAISLGPIVNIQTNV